MFKKIKKNMKNSGIDEELMDYVFNSKNMKKRMVGDFQNIKKCLNLLIIELFIKIEKIII